MKQTFLLVFLLTTLSLQFSILLADEIVTVTATSSDISEDLNLKVVATLFGQAKDLEEFEQLLNNPDSAFSNLDLNGDGDVDYLRVIETADGDRHLVVIQAVLAKDIYQDVASIFVEKDKTTDQVTVQVVGDEYIYGENYIIEPVYIYRPVIYDWFWGPSWVAWHSPYYWDYWPIWWHSYHCIAHHLYWDHCYWYHHHHPICSYRTGHHHHPHYRPMREPMRRNDWGTRHPERSFASRNAAARVSNAGALQTQRRMETRTASRANGTATPRPTANTRVTTAATTTRQNTFNSVNLRQPATRSRVSNNVAPPSRTAATATKANATATRAAIATRTTTTTTAPRTTTATTTRTATATRTTATPTRTTATSTRGMTISRSAVNTSQPMRSSTSTVRSAGTATRSSAPVHSSGGSMRSSSSSSSRSSSTGSRTR